MTTKVHRVTVDIFRPTSAGDPGTIAEGAYTVTDDVVTLTDHAGNPVRDKDGKKYSQKLQPGESAHVIAGRMTKTFRTARRGAEKVEGFNRKIIYPDLGYV
jgi:hypothetical protein